MPVDVDPHARHIVGAWECDLEHDRAPAEDDALAAGEVAIRELGGLRVGPLIAEGNGGGRIGPTLDIGCLGRCDSGHRKEQQGG